MAIRGAVAKNEVVNRLIEAFGTDWVGEFDKKYYVWANDGGERVQIAFTLTCPKSLIGADIAAFASIEPAQRSEITQEENDNIQKMMEGLNLL